MSNCPSPRSYSNNNNSWAICKSAAHPRQIPVVAPPLNFLQAGCPSCHPTNSIKALKAFTQDFVQGNAGFQGVCELGPWTGRLILLEYWAFSSRFSNQSNCNHNHNHCLTRLKCQCRSDAKCHIVQKGLTFDLKVLHPTRHTKEVISEMLFPASSCLVLRKHQKPEEIRQSHKSILLTPEVPTHHKPSAGMHMPWVTYLHLSCLHTGLTGRYLPNTGNNEIQWVIPLANVRMAVQSQKNCTSTTLQNEGGKQLTQIQTEDDR